MKGSSQAAQKPQLRSVESSKRRSKETPLKPVDSHETIRKPHKAVGKSLNAAFGYVSEDISLETKESIDSSPESEVFNCNQSVELAENCELSSSSTPLDSPEPFVLSSFTRSSKIIDEKQDSDHGVGDLNRLQIDNVEAQVFADFLREARFQVSNASDVDRRSKKVLDALVDIFIEDLSGLPAERDRFSELLLTKMRIGCICFFLWIVMVFVFLFSHSGAERSFPDPPPV